MEVQKINQKEKKNKKTKQTKTYCTNNLIYTNA